MRIRLSLFQSTFGLMLFMSYLLLPGVNASKDPQPLNLDAGGFSVNIPETVSEASVEGPNLIANGSFEEMDAKGDRPKDWYLYFMVYADVQDRVRGEALDKLIRPFAQMKVSQDHPHSGQNCVLLRSPRVMYEKRGTEPFNFASGCNRSVELPPLDQDTKFRYSLYYRGEIATDVPGSNARTNIVFTDAAGKQTREFVQYFFVPGKEWKKTFYEFVVPKSTRRLAINLFYDGCGEVYYDDLALQRTSMEKGLSARLTPGYFVDNLYCLSSGDPAVMFFGLRNESGAPVIKPQLVVELPEGINVIGTSSLAGLVKTDPVSREGVSMMQYRFDLARIQLAVGKEDYFTASNHRFCMMVKTNLPSREKRYLARYWIEDGDYQSSPIDLPIQILPQMPTTKAPGLFVTGAMFTGPIHWFKESLAFQEFADFYARSGFNAVDPYPSSLSLELAKRGIKRYSQSGCIGNGYSVRSNLGKMPDSTRFQLMDGTYHPEGICPVEIYQDGKYFQENMIGWLRKDIVTDRQTEHIMPNWEPYMYFFKGCFCPRCKAEFVKFSKLPQETVDKVWPNDVIKDYRESWVKFRSWQHGQMVITLEKTINALGKEAGVESHFIPEIGYNLLLPNEGKIYEGQQQESIKDYADQLPILEPWGPYITDILGQPYEHITGKHLSLHMSATEVRNYIDTLLPADKKSRLLALVMPAPYAYFMQPEAIQFDILTYLLDGWQGCFVYYFPEGYDARYWKILSETNAVISQIEPLVMRGKRKTEHVIKPITPLPDPDKRSMDYYILADKQLAEKWKNCSILQSWEYQTNNQRLITVGNFWQKGEGFFRLIPKELKSGQRYQLSEPTAGRVYANDKGRTDWTATELAKGITLHVGAMRYSFFLLEPYRKDKTKGRIVLPQEMQVVLKKRSLEIEKAYTFEQKLAANKPKEEAGDYSNLKTLQKSGLICKPASIEGTGKTGILFVSPYQQVVVDPSGGGRITNWKIKDNEYAHCEDIFGLMLDGFWWPTSSAYQITQPFTVKSQEEFNQGLRVILERKLGKEANALAGLVVTKTFEVSANKAGFRVKTKITNTTDSDKEFSHRYHNMPAQLELRSGKNGWAEMINEGQPVKFQRIFNLQMFRYTPAPYDRLVLEGYAMDKTKPFSDPRITLSSDWLPQQVLLNLDAKNLLSVAFWDDGALKCATLEPIHRRVRLKPGESWQTQVEWQMK